MAKIKENWVLVFDRDRTLAPRQDAPIPEKVRIVLRELQKVGCKVFISTGKPVSVAIGAAIELGLPEVGVIGENGIDMCMGKSLFPPEYEKTIGLTKEKQKLLLDLRKEMIETFAQDAEYGNAWFQSNKFNATCSYLRGDIRDMDLRNRLIEFFNAKKKLPAYKDFDVYVHFDSVEMVASGVNKGTAIEALRKMYPDYRIASFGDGMNDFPMFEKSDESYGITLKKEDCYRVTSNHPNVFSALEEFMDKHIQSSLKVYKNLRDCLKGYSFEAEKKYIEKYESILNKLPENK